VLGNICRLEMMLWNCE